MDAEMVNGILLVELNGEEIKMNRVEVLAYLRSSLPTLNILKEWGEMFKDHLALFTDEIGNKTYRERMGQFKSAILIELEDFFRTVPESPKYLSYLIHLINQEIDEYRSTTSKLVVINKERYLFQMHWFSNLHANVFLIQQVTQGERQWAIFRACNDFGVLIKVHGNVEQLKEEYEKGLSFAPNKKMYIERRISTLIAANDGRQDRREFWFPSPSNRFTVEFGHYRKIGYAWVIEGHNASWSDLEAATHRNESLNAKVPHKRRLEAYVTLVHELILGGSLAYHISFLQDELTKLEKPFAIKSELLPRTAHKAQFHHMGSQDFERMVFMFFKEIYKIGQISWLGETGGDGGRDIWAELGSEKWCIQCANYQKLSFSKVQNDIDKLVKNQTIPTHYYVIAGGTISVKVRDKIAKYCSDTGIPNHQIWSGAELEANLVKTPDIYRRFLSGDPFPEIF